MKDITDDGTGTIEACLCDSHLCNDVTRRDDIEKLEEGQLEQPTTKAGLVTTPEILTVIGKRNESTNRVVVEETPRKSGGFKVSLDTSQLLEEDAESEDGLQCYSCGSLFSTGDECPTFNSSDSSQVATCSPGEACLLYTWRKSDSELATIRQCFNTEVVLGRLDDPLTPASECEEKDISEKGTGEGRACLCTNNLCNNLNSLSSLNSLNSLKSKNEKSTPTSQQLIRGKNSKEKARQSSGTPQEVKSGIKRNMMTTTCQLLQFISSLWRD